MEQRRLLVIGAHGADFARCAGGGIAQHVESPREAKVVALSYRAEAFHRLLPNVVDSL